MPAFLNARSLLMSRTPPPVPALDFNLLSGVLDGRVTFTRASAAWAYNPSGVLASYATNTPRFDHDPVTLRPLGLLVEEARTNLLLRSAEFSNAAWVTWQAPGTTPPVAANTTAAPDGTTTADTITYGADSWEFRAQYLTVANDAATYAASVYYKPGTAASWQLAVDLLGGTPLQAVTMVSSAGAVLLTTGNGSCTAVGGGWYRVTCAIANNSSGNTTLQFAVQQNGAVAGTVVVWGAQLEAGAFVTSHIPTTAASATRATDVCSIATSGFGFNASEGTLYAAFTPAGVSGLQTAAYLDDGTNGERMGIRSSSGSLAAVVVDGSVSQASVSGGTLTAVATKAAMGYKLNNVAFCANGVSGTTDASATLPTVTKLLIGTRLSGSENLSGWYTHVAYYSRLLPDSTLVRLTT